jgi:hypothetical protein
MLWKNDRHSGVQLLAMPINVLMIAITRDGRFVKF